MVGQTLYSLFYTAFYFFFLGGCFLTIPLSKRHAIFVFFVPRLLANADSNELEAGVPLLHCCSLPCTRDSYLSNASSSTHNLIIYTVCALDNVLLLAFDVGCLAPLYHWSPLFASSATLFLVIDHHIPLVIALSLNFDVIFYHCSFFRLITFFVFREYFDSIIISTKYWLRSN